MLPFLGAVRHFMGLDLEPRELPLNFDFPRISTQLKAGSGSAGKLMRDLREASDNPAEYFAVLLNVIKHLNRCAMKPSERLALTRDTLNLFYPAALEQLVKQAPGGGVPETDERKQVLSRVAEIAQLLGVSLQILFAGIYAGSNFKYARRQALLQECVSRIFDLMLLRQQARALRYQLLEDADWRCVNTLFCVMSRYDDVHQARPTLQKQLGLGTGRAAVSWHDQFVQLHVAAKFDMLRWPTHLQWVVSNYVYGVERAVTTRLSDQAQPGRNELVAYCYAGRAASRLALKPAPGPALLLDLSGLGEAIRKDCMGLMQAKRLRDAALLPPRFARFPVTEHFVISGQLLRGLADAEPDAGAESETSVEDLRIFVGFMEVFSLLRHKQGEFGGDERLADVLAKRSALIAEDHTATASSVWSLLVKNDSMVRLATQESSFTTRMSIGSLLAYGVGEDINRPKVAVVARIHRPSNKQVVIDLHSLADYAEPVLMTVNAAQQPANSPRVGKPALLLHDSAQRGSWQLMFQPQDVLPGVDQTAIHRKRQEVPIELESWRDATHDFHLYSTLLSSAQLGISGQPVYAAVAAPGQSTR